jgi:hypothetical protein
MGQCAAQVFSNVSAAQFQCLVAKAAAQNIIISGNSGSASKDGITIAWNYDPGTQTLTLQCTDSPFYLPCGTINSTIHDLVDSCL